MYFYLKVEVIQVKNYEKCWKQKTPVIPGVKALIDAGHYARLNK